MPEIDDYGLKRSIAFKAERSSPMAGADVVFWPVSGIVETRNCTPPWFIKFILDLIKMSSNLTF